MSGFFLQIGNNKNYINSIQNDVIQENSFYAERFTSNKFVNDKIFVNNDSYFMIVDGIILNKKELLKNKTQTWESILYELYETHGDKFFSFLKGSFSGAIFDKKTNKWIFFSDHIGSKFLYFSQREDELVVSTDITKIYKYYKYNNIKYTLDKNAAYLLLSYGFMLEDYTLSKEVKKLLPGYYLSFMMNFDSKVEVKQFFELDNTPDTTKTEDEFIELMDFYFRQAISRQFEKDKEYGYKHLVALSGGLDSRMTCMVADELGYTDQLNITFSESDYLDETIAKKISRDLNNQWLFKALDGGNFLLDFDEVTKITGGNVLYYGLAHGNSLYKLMNFDKVGILHSGQIGDVVFSTFSNINDKKWTIGDGAYSNTFIHKLNSLKINLNYKNKELFMIFNRAFIGANNGQLMPQKYTETISPFYDIDLLKFALTIPLEYRENHKIYKKWIIKKYPSATNYIWERTKTKITDSIIKFKGKEYYLKEFFLLIINKITKHKIMGIDTRKYMNPLGYWFKTNTKLKIEVNSYFDKQIDIVPYEDLKKDIKELYISGNATEVIQVISLVSAIEVFFNEEKNI